MQIRTVLLGAAALLIFVGMFLGSRASKVPTGVDPGCWYELSPTVGLEVTKKPGPGGEMTYHGTLMIREGDSWRRVDLQGKPRMVPAR